LSVASALVVYLMLMRTGMVPLLARMLVPTTRARRTPWVSAAVGFPMRIRTLMVYRIVSMPVLTMPPRVLHRASVVAVHLTS